MKVSVIILTWNQKDFTLDCLKSLQGQDYRDYETIVVDNASADGTAEAVQTNFPDVELVINTENLGFAGGNNAGVKAASSDSRIIVLLNNDTIVTKTWLSALIKAFDNRRVGVAVSRIHDLYGKEAFYTKDYETMTVLGYNVAYPKSKYEYPDTFYACGCALAYRREIRELPFDDDYFIYYEDVYLSWLARLKGYEVRKALKSELKHFGNAAMKRVSGRKAYLQERNRLINFLIFHSVKDIIALSPWYALSMLFHNIYSPRVALHRIKGYLWCLVHPFKIAEKRKEVQQQRKVPFSDITAHMSCRFYDDENISNAVMKAILKCINACMRSYCRLFRIKTMD